MTPRRKVSSVRIALCIFAALGLTGTVLGQQFWAKKDFREWTEKEVDKMLNDSPWAKNVTVATSAPGGDGIDMGAGGGGGDEGEAGGGGRGGRGGGGGGRNAVTLTISFRSAVPMKQAVLKARLGASGDLPAEAQQVLTREETHYVVMASGLPVRMLQAARNPDELRKSAIKRGKKAAIEPADVQFQQRDRQTVDALFFFPRTDPIVDADKEVEVVLRFGKLDFKKKFALKDMMFNGKLEM